MLSSLPEVPPPSPLTSGCNTHNYLEAYPTISSQPTVDSYEHCNLDVESSFAHQLLEDEIKFNDIQSSEIVGRVHKQPPRLNEPITSFNCNLKSFHGSSKYHKPSHNRFDPHSTLARDMMPSIISPSPAPKISLGPHTPLPSNE